MRKPSLTNIIEQNSDKTGHIPNVGLSRLPKDGWLNQYTNGGIYLSDKAKATQFGQYANGGSSWMLTNPKPEPVMFPRLGDGGLTTQTTMPPATQDSVRHLAGQTMDYEFKKGSPTGGGLSDWGYHNSQLPYNQVPANWHAPQTREEAVNLYMQEIGTNPRLQHFSSAMEKGEAGDFLYNTGRDPRAYMLDQYLKSSGKGSLPNRSSYNVDTKTKNWTPELEQSLNEQWNQYAKEISQLPENERRILLNKGRDFYYQNINQVNGQPNPSYNATWKPRIWESVNQYKANGGDISIPDLSKGWLSKYAPGGPVVCPAGFTKNAFGQCVNTSGQTPNQASAGSQTISGATSTYPQYNAGVMPNRPAAESTAVANNYAKMQAVQFQKDPAVDYMKKFGVDYATAKKAINLNQLAQANNKNATVRQGYAETPQQKAYKLKKNQEFVDANSAFAKLNDEGDIVPTSNEYSLTGKIMPGAKDAIAAKNMKRFAGAGAIGAGLVLGAGVLPEIMAAATPAYEAVGAALNTPLLGSIGSQFGTGALTAGNALTGYSAYEGVHNLPHAAEAYKNAWENPSFKSVGNAGIQTGIEALSFLPAYHTAKGVLGAGEFVGSETLGAVAKHKAKHLGLEESSNYLSPDQSHGVIQPLKTASITGINKPAFKKTGGWLDRHI